MIARFDRFTLDSGRRQLLRDDRHVHLTPKAFDLLTRLVEEAPRVVRKSELHAHLWPDTFFSDATLVVLIKELRAALDDRMPMRRCCAAAHRIGYALAHAVETVHQPTRAARDPMDVVAPGTSAGQRENLIGRHPARRSASGGRLVAPPRPYSCERRDRAARRSPEQNGTLVRVSPFRADRVA